MASPATVPEVVELADERATLALGARLAGEAERGDVFALKGVLGAGKTTFARGFIRALTTPDEEVPSPTFTLVQTYDSRKGPLFHFDLYRLEDPEEAWELGIEDAFAGGISLIEWPERLGPLLPARHRDVTLEIAGTGRRAVLA
jgi:tRNA threonylcarbamoyladenosine biosynthesis protein TsaE